MSRSDFTFLATALALAFLFTGEPDVWDKAHAWAMSSTCAKDAK